MRIKVILNPKADNGRGASQAQVIADAALPFGGVDLVLTERPNHAMTLAQEAIAEGVDLVVAAGGDGTISDVVNGITQVRIEDLTSSERWPEHRDLTLDNGFKSLATVPMPVEGQRIGALDLYCTEPHAWTDEEIRAAQILANMATGYVLNNLKLSESRNLTERLQAALDTRIVVEQATGVLCGRHDIDPPEAHERLRHHARTFGVAMQDVCERVIRGELQL